ncbi:MAG: hypothetical protein J6Y37_12195 [Paludibacteraceae bacterium]|nr:hypothetical protein [Paludibacteraceae bacterium]
MKVYYEIKDILEKELEQIADKRELTSNNLEIMDKVVDIVKDIETICAMKEASEDYSGAYMPRYFYEDGNMSNNSYAMSNGSYARGRGRYARRDSMGRYSSDDGYSGYERRNYSREDSRDHMISELDRMEREAADENQRNMIHNWKNQLKNA